MHPIALFLSILFAGCLGAAEIPISIPVGHAELPPGWVAFVRSDALVLQPPKHSPHVELFSLPGGMDAAKAQGQVAELVKGQVTGWSTTATADVEVAGGPAVRLTATGTEADDADPTSAEATIFTLGDRCFLLLVHGEGFDPAGERTDLDALIASITAR